MGDIDAEREWVDSKRSSAEASDSPCKPEDYVIVDGKYRLVRPYHFDFLCSIKQRWAGQTIVDIFCREFPARSRDYYLRALATGRVREDGAAALHPDHKPRPGDRIRHFLHRHEPCVPATPVTVLEETRQDIVAVNKPAGVPVHVSGQYRKNTVLSMLNAFRPDLGTLLPVHRLDKPVSGVLLFARTAAAADALRLGIEEKGKVAKVYVARVQGAFPASPETGGLVVADVGLRWDPVEGHVFATTAGNKEPCIHTNRGNGEKEGEEGGEGEERKYNGRYNHASGAGGGVVHSEGKNIDLVAGEQQTLQGGVVDVAKCGQDGRQTASGGGCESGSGRPIALSKRQRKKEERRIENKRRKQARLDTSNGAVSRVSDAINEEKDALGGRRAVTHCRLIAVAPDGATSLVECRPLTGRTHQIRAHLAWLGYPIANDRQYGGGYAGPQGTRALALSMGVAWDQGGSLGIREAGNNSETQKDQGAADGSPVAVRADTLRKDASADQGNIPNVVGDERKQLDLYATETRRFTSSEEFEAPAELRDPLCPHCPYYAPRNYPVELRPLWLHAARYECEGEWRFEAPLPDWASEGYQP
jgi:23S rRNA-/tRNA-specific pseudouridylate synthase